MRLFEEGKEVNFLSKKEKGHLYIFNCDCEMAIANGGKFYMPPTNIRKMMSDLAYLPAYLGNKCDYVLVGENMKEERANELQVDCKTITLEELEIKQEKLIGAPWGMSPGMCHWLSERGMGEKWKEEQKEWHSRRTALEGLHRLMQSEVITDMNILPHICYSLKEVQEKMEEGYLLVKAPWSSSGKGLLHLHGSMQEKAGEWISGILKKQGYVMLEKFLDKVEDFAMEFQVTDDEVCFMGWSWFTTGKHGEYCGNYIGSQKNIEDRLSSLVGCEVLQQLQIQVPKMLKNILPKYRGFLGVDMMIYRDEKGDLQVQPCVEINLRCNMGIIALYLSRKYVADGVVGKFSIAFYPRNGEALQEHRRLSKKEPAVYENNRIKSGYLALTPINETTHFVASLRCY